MSDLREQIIELVRAKGYQRSEQPFTLASGQTSHDYIDGKRALAQGRSLALLAKTTVHEVDVAFDAVGGLTMGADAIAHAVALHADCLWFSVRKAAKGRGLNKWVEGAALDATHRVLLVDDVVTTGGSIMDAYERVLETGASVVAAMTLVDRGDKAAADFADLGIPYHPLVTYRDLGIDRVGPQLAAASG